MGSLIESIWYHVAGLPEDTWQWFRGLSREEWLVLLAVVCASGFVCLMGFGTRRL